MAKAELLKGLTPEQVAKVDACNGSDEILALAKAEGVELTDEQLAAVSGGACEKKKPNHPKQDSVDGDKKDDGKNDKNKPGPIINPF